MRKCFKRGNIPSSVFNTLLEQFNEHNFIPRVVVFYHGGEPLRNKELPAMISVFKNLGVKKTVITTNTSLLNKEVALQLQDAGLDELKVSYDGCSPEENNEIRKNANFEINSKNLISFLENNNHTNVIISNVQICTKNEIDNFCNGIPLQVPDYLYNRFSSYDKVSFTTFPAMIWPGLKNLELFDIYIYIQKEFPKACPTFNETITILSTGEVVPCCYDITGETILGNILEEDIFSIRNNKQSHYFYDALSKGVLKTYPQLCQKCLLITKKYLIKKDS
ncbi:radical SAM/SPASM domain-containing protein [Thomasclavelia cocleata]|uniref:radical SAM/SPASM domain-containing protein n=1 Tax=Thomasclavelia cocleata TaxID=69824 RepID=UPI0025A18135|nr:radical SAM/SPASM domain-containing protein [Thomasclavelia cocleata]